MRRVEWSAVEWCGMRWAEVFQNPFVGTRVGLGDDLVIVRVSEPPWGPK